MLLKGKEGRNQGAGVGEMAQQRLTFPSGAGGRISWLVKSACLVSLQCVPFLGCQTSMKFSQHGDLMMRAGVESELTGVTKAMVTAFQVKWAL